MSLLSCIHGPRDLDRLTPEQLEILADEIRSFLVAAVSRNGGHLGPNLGVVELTIALHRVFETPRDKVLFDGGHQAYVHKLLTGRQDFSTLFRKGGLSGYQSPAESEHDVIENTHVSITPGWADGLAKAHQIRGVDDRHVVAVIGDGSLTGGMAWEALNNITVGKDRPLVIVVNDNKHSYDPTIGGLAGHLETLGLAYFGPIDGHDIGVLESAFRDAKRSGCAAIVHCLTEKGRGYRPAEQDAAEHFHAVSPFHPDTGLPVAESIADWTSVFGDELVKIGAEREDVVAITAAMLRPVGLEGFAEAYPERTYDVGIAEQHAVVSAAGLATGGLHPVVAVYATFFNRAFDQVLMDVALHRCAVTFVLDRAGVTGDDGASFNGTWDLSILQVVPGLRIAAPRDADQLRLQLREAVAVEAPTVVRFSRGTVGPAIPAIGRIDGMDVLRQTENACPDVLLVSVGALAPVCLGVSDLLEKQGISTTVVDPRWVQPVNEALPELAAQHRVVVTVEDNSRAGGVGSAIAQALRDADVDVPLRDFGVPRRFLSHASREEVLADIGLTAPDIAQEVSRLVARLATGTHTQSGRRGRHA
ncbi:1-deoxy-D-xylulose-5-phosphate synthase [Streptomyces sioyaensis]|uniref:1-deoxy-D-xylulose-5-phosphate synthase n=1 Tax=Streptomyces sioyaensis TaxID=67364 RepID=UPI0037D933B1